MTRGPESGAAGAGRAGGARHAVEPGAAAPATAAAVRIAVEPWAPEYGGSVEGDALAQADADVDVAVELAPAAWRPLDPASPLPARRLDLIDGVRRIDARVWITLPAGAVRLGICASYAAGVVRCEGARATIVAAEVRRALFAPAGTPDLETGVGRYPALAVAGDGIDQLSLGLQERMGALEREVAALAARGAAAGAVGGSRASGGSVAPDASVDAVASAASGAEGAPVATGDDALVVLDGPLTGRQHIPGAVGYVKTHRVAYLPDDVAGVVPRLAAGQRTPLFVTQTSWSRYAWYLRLPGPTPHPWSAIARCEASADLPLAAARRLADLTAATLPRLASAAHKDPRAPQNLYPIAGLERELRRRLGDPARAWRALRAAAG
jgi:hypothetical protein